MTLFFGIVIAIILLGLIIFAHESGHFFAAKLFGVKGEEFGFGFPPRLWGKKIGETIYSINAVPAGGFVRLLGEDGGESSERSLSSKGPWTRSAVLVAGVFMNVLVAFTLFTLPLAFNHFQFEAPTSIPTSGAPLNLKFPFGSQSESILIVAVDENSPAEKAGIAPPDEVLSVNGKTPSSVSDLQNIVDQNKGKEMILLVRDFNSSRTKAVTLVPRVNPPSDQGPLGVGLGSFYVIRCSSLADKVFVGPLHAGNMIYEQYVGITSLVNQSIEEHSAAPVSNAAHGPVGIVAFLGKFIGQAGASATWTIVMVVGLISLMLGVINLLPIPAADGGRLIFALIEGVFRVKVNESIERWVNTVGFMFLILLFILLTFNDIRMLIFG